jgi:hypothetical protein
MGIGESHAPVRKGVDCRCLHLAMLGLITGDVSPTKIVGEDDDDMRSRRGHIFGPQVAVECKDCYGWSREMLEYC